MAKITLEDCHELVDSFWNDAAKAIFPSKDAMCEHLILMIMSAKANINLLDPSIVMTIMKDENPLDLLSNLLDLQ